MPEVFTGTVDVVEVRFPDEIIMSAGPGGGAAVGPIGSVAGTPAVSAVGPVVGGGQQILIIRLNANKGEIICGGDRKHGTLRLLNAQRAETVTLDAQFSNLRLGGNGSDGDILLFAGAGDRNNTAAASIHLDGEAGDILFRNGDCAEELDFAEGLDVRPGNVVSLGSDGALHLASDPYDRRVAGIVSGAGDTRPGIILGRDPSRGSRVPVALAGRVQCWVDAAYGSIQVGDLLTTSATPGHAMRAGDPTRAFGSVIGKAMRPLASGTGLVPVLVALQ
ncbi:MAG: hypothetical protein ACT4P6_22260 [Gemmatimonadaceae bacterium]